jgi:hypothetical protein
MQLDWTVNLQEAPQRTRTYIEGKNSGNYKIIDCSCYEPNLGNQAEQKGVFRVCKWNISAHIKTRLDVSCDLGNEDAFDKNTLCYPSYNHAIWGKYRKRL